MKKSKVSKSVKVTVAEEKEIRNSIESDANIEVNQENTLEIDRVQVMKDMLLSALNSENVVMSFFDKSMYELLLSENKIVNVPTETRASNYNSLANTLRYENDDSEHALGMSRGRMFFAIASDMSIDTLINFDLHNRKIENTQLSKKNIRRKLLMLAKGYFPYLNVKEKYPIASFKD